MHRLQLKKFLARESGETAAEQARRIFERLMVELEAYPDRKIALIYSATNKQAERIHQSYQQNDEYIPLVRGHGQAKLYRELISLINSAIDEDLIKPGQLRVLPIATSLKGGNNDSSNAVSDEIIQRDLTAIEQHLQNDYDVFGIPTVDGDYAIGGGISRYWYLTKYAEIEGMSQGEFVQEQLKKLEPLYLNDEPANDLNYVDLRNEVKLKVAKVVRNDAEWKRIKDDLTETAKAYNSLEQIPHYIQSALQNQYCQTGSIKDLLNKVLYGEPTTEHWQEVLDFFEHKKQSI